MATSEASVPSVLPIKKYGPVVITLDNVLLPADKLSPTPSKLDHLDSELETDLRVIGCELIQTGGILLKLPQVAMATGQVLFQRFYFAKSLVRYPMEATAMACVALASKIEEAPRKIRDVIGVFNHIRQVKAGRAIQSVLLDNHYIAQKNLVIKAERRLLKELGFCCHVKHPHKIIISYLRMLESDGNSRLAQSSWNYMNDALRSDTFLRHTPETIACACIWLSARFLRIPLPESPPWYAVVGATEEDILDVARTILGLYARKKLKLEVLEGLVDHVRHEQQEERLRNKTVASLAATPHVNTVFSPAGSRNPSPNALQSQSGQTKKKSSSPHRHSGGRKRSDSSRSPSRSRGGSRSSHSPHHRRDRKRRRRGVYSPRSRTPHSDKSRTPSPAVTPPPMFTKNKDKGSIVKSRSRSPPTRNYDKYERPDKYEKDDRYEKQSAGLSKADKSHHSDKGGEKYEKFPIAKTEGKSGERHSRGENFERTEKHGKSSAILNNHRGGGDDGRRHKQREVRKTGQYEDETARYEGSTKYEVTSKYEKYDGKGKLESSGRYESSVYEGKGGNGEKLRYERYDSAPSMEKYPRLEEKYVRVEEKYIRVEEKYSRLEEKYPRVEDKYTRQDEKFLKAESKRQYTSDEKMSDNGYFERPSHGNVGGGGKVHKVKKNGGHHRSRSREEH